MNEAAPGKGTRPTFKIDQMKPNDLEKKIAGQPMKSLPAEWRAEILSAARKAAAPAAPQATAVAGESWGARWREYLWPSPVAWGALAAVWVLIFALNHSSDSAPQTMARNSKASPQTIMAFWEQNRLLVELLTPTPPASPEPPPAESPRENRPRPRSEKRSGLGLG